MVHRESLTIETRGRSTYEITGQVQAIVARSRIKRGLCNVFLMHTSASLIVCENADPSVRRDLEALRRSSGPGRRPRVQPRPRGPGRHAGPYPVDPDPGVCLVSPSRMDAASWEPGRDSSSGNTGRPRIAAD